MLASTNLRLRQGKVIPHGAIAVSVLKIINIQATFKELDEHMVDNTVNGNRVCKLILKNCIEMRVYQLGKTTTEITASKKAD